MPGFSITPSAAFPPASSDGFPRFMQWQQDGVDVGDTSVETVNVVGGTLTVSSGGGTLTITIVPGSSFAWTEFDGDITLALGDADNGLASTNTSGAQVLTVPANADVAFEPGATILVLQDGGAQVQVAAAVGVTLLYRAGTFNPYTAGEGAVLTLIYRGADRWVVCGDMELVV